MIKNGKFFRLPKDDGSNFKELFHYLASAGVGRPVDKNGHPHGPWTPELLAEAISRLEGNQSGIELRTVQLWFQDNDKGISSENIRWLARIFGCDDPETTSQWQSVISASQMRLTAERRRKNSMPDTATYIATHARQLQDHKNLRTQRTLSTSAEASAKTKYSLGLARWSERLLTSGSPLDLPASVFAGAVILGLTSYFLGIQSVTYMREDGALKQAGFLWAPNWTILFMVFMPLFFAFTIDLLGFWRSRGRCELQTVTGAKSEIGSWEQRIEASSYTFWAVFLVCLGFAGILQWASVRLIPIVEGDASRATDWGSLAIARPDIISQSEAIAFTGAAYLYMSVCFYIFFVGLILLYTLVHDFWEIEKSNRPAFKPAENAGKEEIRQRVMYGIFRCTISGLLIAICMKLQSAYLATSAASIVDWLVRDARSILFETDQVPHQTSLRTPTHYTSLLVAMSTCAVFIYCCARLYFGSRPHTSLPQMAAAVMLIGAAYLTIGAFDGFSVFLGLTFLLAMYGLLDPSFGLRLVR